MMSKTEFLTYEILSSRWASLIWWGWGQDLTAMYFAWKTRRKYARYVSNLAEMSNLKRKIM